MNHNDFTMEENFMFEKFKRDIGCASREEAIALAVEMMRHMIYQDKVHKKVMRQV